MNRLLEWVGHAALAWIQRLGDGRVAGAATAPTVPATNDAGAESGARVLLHVGCGHANLDGIPLSGFHQSTWQEVRLDADASVSPDIVGTMVVMDAVADGFADAIFSSHGIEHLYWHDVPLALAEFRRVLKDDGFAVITCPDVQAAAQMIAEDRMFETAYQSPAGAITPFDILYSYRPFVAANPQWMSHHCGFTLSTLMAVLKEAGFAIVNGMRRPGGFDLWVLASKSPRTPDEMTALSADYLIPIQQNQGA
jgi:hypothetical protein